MSQSKTCKRCQSQLFCNSNDISQCACSQVKLAASTLDFLAQTRWDCLCNNCLAHFEQLNQSAQGLLLPQYGATLIEDVHYYKEDGRFVFTELYLLLRGYCCGNTCRHCVYGFEKNMTLP